MYVTGKQMPGELYCCCQYAGLKISLKMNEQRNLTAMIPVDAAGRRLDKVLTSLFPPYSRSQLQNWLREGRMTMEGSIPSQRQIVRGGERLRLLVPKEAPQEWQPQSLPLQVVYEDSEIVVIDKPAGLVVHPGAGNPDTTLANAVLHHYPENRMLPRAGVVHRLDKGTTGLLVVARTESARQKLITDLEARTIQRYYLALVHGRPVAGGTVDEPIGRHPKDRRRMAVSNKGKPAVTHFRIEQRYDFHTLLRVRLETGRTHQIRVHLAHAGLPLVGDLLYGGRPRMPPRASTQLTALLRSFDRQALHATKLSITHPDSGTRLTWESALPQDFQQLLEVLSSHYNIV
jgi:23S rRNA pseudouridine1911/1915/1917 synthase